MKLLKALKNIDVKAFGWLQKSIKFNPDSLSMQLWLVRITLWITVLNLASMFIVKPTLSSISLFFISLIYTMVLNYNLIESLQEIDHGKPLRN